MSNLTAWKNERLQGFEIRGVFDPREAVVLVKQELIKAVVDQLMERIGPKLDKALADTFREKGE